MCMGNVCLFEGEPLRDGSGNFRLEDVRRAIESRLHLVPRYRRKIMEVPGNLSHPALVDDPDFDIREPRPARDAAEPGQPRSAQGGLREDARRSPRPLAAVVADGVRRRARGRSRRDDPEDPPRALRRRHHGADHAAALRRVARAGRGRERAGLGAAAPAEPSRGLRRGRRAAAGGGLEAGRRRPREPPDGPRPGVRARGDGRRHERLRAGAADLAQPAGGAAAAL